MRFCVYLKKRNSYRYRDLSYSKRFDRGSHGAVVASRPGDRKVPGSNPSSGGGDFEK